jgi:hypothetical protein
VSRPAAPVLAALAAATFEGEEPEELELIKEDGDWKISGLP